MKARLIPAILLLGLLPLTTAQAAVLKIATLAPDGTSWMTEMRAAGKEISRRTNNRVKLKFYPGGIMGNEKSVLRKMRIGQLHGSAFTNSTLNKLSKESHTYSVPLKFRNYDEVNHVRKKLDSVIIKSLYREGYTAYRIAGDGFAYLMSQKPIKNLNELKQEKVWVPKGDIVSRAMLEHLGISPISLPLTDVLTGLQTGLFTTIGSTPTFSIALQWHTKVNYLIDVPMFFTYGALVFSNKSLKRISKADQKVMNEVIGKTFDRLNKSNWENNLKAKKALTSTGIKIIKPDAAEMKKMYKMAEEVTQKLIAEGAFLKGMVKEVDKSLKQYRKSNK